MSITGKASLRRVGFFLFSLLLGTQVLCQQKALQEAKRASNSPKCVFLRSEQRRIGQDAQDFAASTPVSAVTSLDSLASVNGTIESWANYVGDSEVFVARGTIIGLEAAACNRATPLSDKSRLNAVDAAQVAQIRRITRRWQTLAGDQGASFLDGIAAKVNAVYDNEAKSFYNDAIARYSDPDVGKDYPDLLSTIQASALDQSTKEFYSHAAAYLSYEEAGRLYNILRGIDKGQGLLFAYSLRNTLSQRESAGNAERDQGATERDQAAKDQLSEQMREKGGRLMKYAVWCVLILVLIAVVWIATDPTRAKYRAFRLHLRSSPFWGGNAEWIFWEPGETVVLLEHKHLIPMTDTEGGYRVISAWRGQEYKGRISYKTQVLTWKSDPIITSDGLPINLSVGIWWRIANASEYVKKISSEYQEGGEHKGDNLADAADFWIKTMAAGTLRERVNKLPAEKLISPYVQAYLQVHSGNPDGVAVDRPVPDFSDQLKGSKEDLEAKLAPYGIQVERLEVQELILPPVYQQKLEAVRIAFLEPTQATALTRAQQIALEGLASVIGAEKVGLIEVLKHVDLSHIAMNPFSGTIPILQPVIDTLNRQGEKALPPGEK
jgi:hypothetical protein